MISECKKARFEPEDIYIILAWLVLGFKDIKFLREDFERQIELVLADYKEIKLSYYQYRKEADIDFLEYLASQMGYSPEWTKKMRIEIDKLKKGDELWTTTD